MQSSLCPISLSNMIIPQIARLWNCAQSSLQSNRACQSPLSQKWAVSLIKSWGSHTLKIKVALLDQGSEHGLPWEWWWGEIWDPFFHCDDDIHIPFLIRSQRVSDDVWSGYIIELYQLVVNEILDTISHLGAFFKGMPFSPKMVFTFLG